MGKYGPEKYPYLDTFYTVFFAQSVLQQKNLNNRINMAMKNATR